MASDPLGSECDSIVSAQSAVQVWDMGHRVVYTSENGATCYNHVSAVHDQLDANDASQWWCDWQDNGGVASCNTGYPNYPFHGQDARGLYDMLNALWSDQW